jgi:uncharacterized membrane protein (DUF2068 family)
VGRQAGGDTSSRRWGRPSWWKHPETLTCGLRGHATGLVDSPEWAHLQITTVDGRRLDRCLRCDAWIPAGNAGTVPLEPDRVPRRGKELRGAVTLRLIAVERGVHTVVFTLATIGLIILRLHLPAVQAAARQITTYRSGGFAGPGQVATQSTLLRYSERVLHLRRNTLGVLALVTAVYAVLEGTETVGLWLERRWAEYLTAVATAGFLPFEIDELAKHVSVLKVAALVINLAVLAYLVWRKHLFGIGGRPAPEDRLAALKDPA